MRRRFLCPGLTVSEHTRKLSLDIQKAMLWHLHPVAEPREEEPDADERGHQQRDAQNDEVDGHGLLSCYREGDAD
jgi:hypothetical protein